MVNKSLCVRTLHPLFSMPHGNKQCSEFILKTKKQPLDVSQEVADFSSKADTRSWSIGWVLKNMPAYIWSVFKWWKTHLRKDYNYKPNSWNFRTPIIKEQTKHYVFLFQLPLLVHKKNIIIIFIIIINKKHQSSSIISPFANLPALLFKILECSKSFLNRLTRLKSAVSPKKWIPKILKG